MKKRIYEYDIIRTIATFSVVIVHITAIGIVGFEQYSPHSLLTIFINRMLKYTTPVFIYLAGALIYQSYRNKPYKYLPFLRSRFKRIIIPYALVSLMYYLLLTYMTQGVLSMKTFSTQLLTGSAQYHLYFIPIIIQMYLLTPVFLFLKEKVALKYLMPALAIVSYISTLMMKFQYSDRIFFKFMIPFTLGLYFGDQILDGLKSLGKKVYVIIVITVGVGFYYAYEFVHYFYGEPSLETLRDTGWFFYCILSLFVLTYIAVPLVKKDRLRKSCSHISKISYYIYLLHPLFLALSEKIINRFGITSTSVRMVFHLAFVIIISTVVAHIVYKVLQWNIYKHYKRLDKKYQLIIATVLILFLSVGSVFSYNVLVDKGYLVSVESKMLSKDIEKQQALYHKTDYVYENAAYGFKFYHSNFEVDDTNETILTKFHNEDTVVDVYYENLDGVTDSSKSYTNYSNMYVVDGDFVKVTQDEFILYKDNQIRLLAWERPTLLYVENDKNYYSSIDIIKSNQEVYNIYIRSNKPIEIIDYLARLEIVEKNESTKLKSRVIERKDNKNINDQTKAFYQTEFLDDKKISWGIFDPRVPANGLTPVKEIEDNVGYDFKYILHYSNLDTYINMNYYHSIYEANKVFEYTLQTSEYYNPDKNTTFRLLNGEYDQELIDFASALKDLDGPVLFRLNNEMNGDWCLYNSFFYQKDASLYIAMWHHIYEVFENVGANNVLWVFNPNEKDLPPYKWNHYLNYFPGEEYVDIIGVTGYNTGDYYPGEVWRGFKEIYDDFMPEYDRTFVGYPFMITEFGSSTFGGNKEEWMQEMFEVIDGYNFKAAIYWNSVDKDVTDSTKEARIYRFNDDEAILKIFLEYLKKY